MVCVGVYGIQRSLLHKQYCKRQSAFVYYIVSLLNWLKTLHLHCLCSTVSAHCHCLLFSVHSMFDLCLASSYFPSFFFTLHDTFISDRKEKKRFELIIMTPKLLLSLCMCKCSFSFARIHYIPFDWFMYGNWKTAHTCKPVWWSMQCMSEYTEWQLKRLCAYAEGHFFIIVIFEGANLWSSKWMLSFSLISIVPRRKSQIKCVGHTLFIAFVNR